MASVAARIVLAGPSPTRIRVGRGGPSRGRRVSDWAVLALGVSRAATGAARPGGVSGVAAPLLRKLLPGSHSLRGATPDER
jgi:hypothetical protein